MHNFSRTSAILSIITATLSVASADVLYVCGNHEPHHVATDFASVRRATKEHGCKGWDVQGAKASLSADARKSLLNGLQTYLAAENRLEVAEKSGKAHDEVADSGGRYPTAPGTASSPHAAKKGSTSEKASATSSPAPSPRYR